MFFFFSAVPIGLCFPHMNEIKDKYGFKNFYLGNNEPCLRKDTLDFMSEELTNLFTEYG